MLDRKTIQSTHKVSKHNITTLTSWANPTQTTKIKKKRNLIMEGQFAGTDRWAPMYQRNNKRSGLKNIRCFPYCSDEHHNRGSCGRPVVLKLANTERFVLCYVVSCRVMIFRTVCDCFQMLCLLTLWVDWIVFLSNIAHPYHATT